MIDADVVRTVSEIAVLWIVYQKDIYKKNNTGFKYLLVLGYRCIVS